MDVGDFLDMVRDNWNIEMDGRLIQRLWRNLKRLQPILRGMSRRLSRNTQKTQEYKGKLDLTQQKLNGDMFNLELIHKVKNLTDEILNNTEVEEIILMKNSKVSWLKLNDDNNAYFHAIMKEKNKQTELQRLEDKHGKVLGEFMDIEKEII